MKTVIVSAITSFGCALALAVAPALNVTFFYKWMPNQADMAGLSTNDYCTNLTVTIVSTLNVAIPTNQWPVVGSVPMTSLLAQGPPGTLWSNQLVMDGSSRFYAMVVTNGNGGSSPFSNLAPGLTDPAAGVLWPLKLH